MNDTLGLEQAVAFVDHRNTQAGLRQAGRRIELDALREYLSEGRRLVESFLYFAIHPDPARRAADEALVQRLRENGYLVRSKLGQALPNGDLDCAFNVEIALDVQEFVNQRHPGIVVLVTGDGALTSLVERLRLQGVRVEAASTPAAIAANLRAMVNGFIDLTQTGEPADNLILPAPEPAPIDPPDILTDFFPPFEEAMPVSERRTSAQAA